MNCILQNIYLWTCLNAVCCYWSCLFDIFVIIMVESVCVAAACSNARWDIQDVQTTVGKFMQCAEKWRGYAWWLSLTNKQCLKNKKCSCRQKFLGSKHLLVYPSLPVDGMYIQQLWLMYCSMSLSHRCSILDLRLTFSALLAGRSLSWWGIEIWKCQFHKFLEIWCSTWHNVG